MTGLRTCFAMFAGAALALAACGDEGDRTTRSSALEGDDDIPEKDGELDPGTGTTEPLPSCASAAFTCAVIIDKENLCAADLSPRWDLGCGDNEVCCGAALPESEVIDPCVEAPGDPKCTGT